MAPGAQIIITILNGMVLFRISVFFVDYVKEIEGMINISVEPGRVNREQVNHGQVEKLTPCRLRPPRVFSGNSKAWVAFRPSRLVNGVYSMCGRYTLTVNSDYLAEHFQLRNTKIEYYLRYNIAPGQNVPVIGLNRGEKGLAFMRWGLIPPWAKEASAGYKMINARAETVDRKPAFRASFYNSRCLIPADSFFEWKKIGGKKQPVRFILPDKPVFAFAGLWSLWHTPEGEKVFSCSIIATMSNDFVKNIHDRMPVILANKEAQDKWLTWSETGKLKSLLRPYQGKMRSYAVSTRVNSPHNDSPDCIEEVDFPE